MTRGGQKVCRALDGEPKQGYDGDRECCSRAFPAAKMENKEDGLCMNYAEVLANARECIGKYCKACPVCNGVACKNQIPGPGAKGVGDTAIRNYNKWADIRVNMDTLCEGGTPDTHVELFGKTFAYPFFAGPVGAVNLHYSEAYTDMTYNDVLVRACAENGIAAFTGDGTNPTVMEMATKAIGAANGCGVPTIKPWNIDTIKEKTGFDLEGKSEEEIRDIAVNKLKMEGIDESFGKGKLIDEIFGEFCEGTFIQPTFIIDYPVEMSPLTKMHRSKPGLTERFELMVNGKELANAYSELNDPIDQDNRFKEQMKLADKGDDEAMIIDQDFLRALQYGMPPTSGIGIGIDRLCMLMIGKENIQEIILFPQMKPEAKMPQSSIKEWAALGVPEDWVYVLRKAGFNLISDVKDEKAQGLQQKIGEINKKYKLGHEKPSVDDIQHWIDGAKNL